MKIEHGTSVGVVHGRFQVFHLEHLHYLKEASQSCDFLIVGITSPDPTNLVSEPSDRTRGLALSNPFSFFERAEMVRWVLNDDLGRADSGVVVPFPIEQPERLSNYLPAESVHFMTVHDAWGEAKCARLRSLGYEVVVLPRPEGKTITSTQVREAIRAGDEWKHLVPLSVSQYLVSSGLCERIGEVSHG